MDSVIFTRIKELCAENNITINKLESELGMSQYSIGRWKSSTSPTIDKISKIAEYFHVSIDYLVGASNGALYCRYHAWATPTILPFSEPESA